MWGKLGRAAGFAGLLLLTVLLAFGAAVGVAVYTTVPALFLAAGWVVLALGTSLSARLAIRPPARRRLAVSALAVLTLVGGFGLLWPQTGRTPAAPAGMRTVVLPTGSRLAYLKLTGTGSQHHTPVIFVHGGPGVADMRGDSAYLRPLADAGYDVYLYDQLGAGHSERLSDPSGYTIARALADLDAFRQAIGAPRVDLLAYSWGATLSAAYLAAHPDRVDKVVFASPGAMVGGTSDVNDLLGRLSLARRLRVYRQALVPRALLAWTLVQVNPRAAHAYAGDAEMDARFRRLSAAVAPGLFCHPVASAGADVGFYANAVMLRPSVWRRFDPHQALRQVRTPALVVKGSCDYLSWASAVDYRTTLPDARMVYLAGTGHQLYAERPKAFFATVEAFLAGRPLPVPVETRSTPPADYQGPE
jgi:proline iminopeptidase